MPTLKQVVDVLEDLYPLRYAEEWDAPGLIVGDLHAPVRRVAFAVDPTMEVVREVLAMSADLLICHHPLFFRPVHAVSGLDFRGAIVGELYGGHCALWVGHTNADCAYRGVAQAAADAFGLIEQRPLIPVADSEAKQPVGLGRIGRLEQPLRLEEFARRVAAALPPTKLGVQVGGDPSALVSSVAVLPGSGDSMFDEVRECVADVYVTSDLRHHPATDALQQMRYEASLRADGIAAGRGNSSGRPALINTAHSAIESLWLRYAIEDVPKAMERSGAQGFDEVRRIERSTDPWELSISYDDLASDKHASDMPSFDGQRVSYGRTRRGTRSAILRDAVESNNKPATTAKGNDDMKHVEARKGRHSALGAAHDDEAVQGTRIDMDKPAQIIGTKKVYQGAIFSVEDRAVLLSTHEGEPVALRRQVVCHAPSVVMLVHDTANDRYLAEREYRAGSNVFAYGIPAGLIDPGEDMEKAALRELREETGVEPEAGAVRIDHVGAFHSSEGMCDEIAHVMVLHLDRWHSVERHFDADEYVESAWVSWRELSRLPITSSNPVIAIQHEELRRLREETSSKG
jgi:dinuclear metal center YbgI/SA1388 family protein